MAPYVFNATNFLMETFFLFINTLLLARVVLYMVRADFYNPLCQFVINSTDFAVKPLKKILPTYKALDFASVFVFLLFIYLEKASILYFKFEIIISFKAFMLSLPIEVLSRVLSFMMYSIIFRALLSFIQPGSYNPLTDVLIRITEPLIGRCRRLLPNTQGLDFAPMLAIILLILSEMLILQPLIDLTNSL